MEVECLVRRCCNSTGDRWGGVKAGLNWGSVGVIRKTQVRFKKSSHSTGLNGWLGVGMRESITPGPVLGGHVDGWWHHSWSEKFRELSPLCHMGALHPDLGVVGAILVILSKTGWFTARHRKDFDKKV